MNKKVRRIVVPLVVLAVIGAVAIYFVPKLLRSRRSTSGTTGFRSFYVVAKQDVATTTTESGTVAPGRTATVTAQAAGKITAVYKKEGDKVQAGDVIARIDNTSYQDTLTQAEINYRSTLIGIETTNLTDLAQTKTDLQNALKQAQTQELTAELNLKNATAKNATDTTMANLQDAVTQAEENLTTAQNNLKNLQTYDTTALQQQLADSSVKQAELNLSMAQTKLANLKSQDVTATQLQALQDQVRQAKSSLLSAQTNLQQSAKSTTTTDAQLELLQNQVDNAQASLDEAQGNLNNAHTTYKASQSDIDNQTIAVQQAQMALANAEANYQMTEDTLAQKKDTIAAAQLSVTQAQRSVDAAKRNLAAGQTTTAANAGNIELLQADVDQAKDAVVTAKTNLAAYPKTVQNYNLQVEANSLKKEQALLTLNQTKEQSDNYVITAPWSGTVTSVSVQTGDAVTNGGTIATVADESAWYIEAYVDETDLLTIKAGQSVAVTMDAYNNKTFNGTVSYVGHTLTQNSQSVSSYAIKIKMTNPPATIVDGMSCDAAITIADVKNVLAVPAEAIATENGKKYVTVVTIGADRKITTSRQEVTTGAEGDDYTQILSGVKEGDRILRSVTTTTSSSSSTTSTTSSSTSSSSGNSSQQWSRSGRSFLNGGGAGGGTNGGGAPGGM